METIVKEAMTMEKAIELANEIERVETALKAMKDELKVFVEKNGTVDTGERIWNFNESVSWNIKSDKLEALADYIYLSGKNHWDYFNITPANIKKLDFNDEILEQFG